MLRERVPMRIALHRHPGIHGVVEAAEDILRAVPGIEIVDLHQPAVGCRATISRMLPAYRRELQEQRACWRPKQPASMRWSRSIIPTTANYARMSATSRSAS